MARPPMHYQVGIAVLDTPRLAIATAEELLDIGLKLDQVCLVAVRRVLVACARLAASFAGGHERLTELLGDARRWAAPAPDDATDCEIVATQQQLFQAFLRSQLTEAGSIVRSQARRQRWDVECAIRNGASAIVTHPCDTRQHLVATRILLANSTHNVTTYDLPPVEATARRALLVASRAG
jgi:hypothetical protein